MTNLAVRQGVVIPNNNCSSDSGFGLIPSLATEKNYFVNIQRLIMSLTGILRRCAAQCLSLWISLYILFMVFIKWCFKGNVIFEVKERKTPPAILNDKKWGNHGYMTLKKSGIKVHYVSKGERSSPLMLCLHGFPECWFSWRHQLVEFSSKFWVVAVDMRGYGDSDKPNSCSSYSIGILTEDIKDMVEALGKQRCTLIGHDWGGVLAWFAVIKYSSLFERHISLNGPHLHAFDDIVKSSLTQMLRSWYIIFFQTPWIPEFVLKMEDLSGFDKAYVFPNSRQKFSEEELEAYKYYYSQKNAFKFPINYYRSIPSELPSVSKVKVPSLIIWGTEDKYLLKDIATQTSKYVEDLQIKYVDGASHWVQMEEPTYVNKLIWEYIDITK